MRSRVTRAPPESRKQAPTQPRVTEIADPASCTGACDSRLCNCGVTDDSAQHRVGWRPRSCRSVREWRGRVLRLSVWRRVLADNNQRKRCHACSEALRCSLASSPVFCRRHPTRLQKFADPWLAQLLVFDAAEPSPSRRSRGTTRASNSASIWPYQKILASPSQA